MILIASSSASRSYSAAFGFSTARGAFAAGADFEMSVVSGVPSVTAIGNDADFTDPL